MSIFILRLLLLNLRSQRLPILEVSAMLRLCRNGMRSITYIRKLASLPPFPLLLPLDSFVRLTVFLGSVMTLGTPICELSVLALALWAEGCSFSTCSGLVVQSNILGLESVGGSS